MTCLNATAMEICVTMPLAAAFTADVTSGTAPLGVQFTDQSTGTVTSWFWDFGDSETSSEQNPSHTYINAGNYTVSLTVTGLDESDTETKTDYIHVHEPCGVPVIDKIGNRICSPAEKIRIIGFGFGPTPGDSLFHIANRTFDKDSPRIKYWSDTLIRIKIPNYQCAWFKGKDYKNPKWTFPNPQKGQQKRQNRRLPVTLSAADFGAGIIRAKNGAPMSCKPHCNKSILIDDR